MSDSLPNVDEVKEIANEGLVKRNEKDAGIISKYKVIISDSIHRAIEGQYYKLTYTFTESIPRRVLDQLRDWIKEQPGYQARWRWGELSWYPEMIVKIPTKHQTPRRWPLLLRWIPGLG